MIPHFKSLEHMVCQPQGREGKDLIYNCSRIWRFPMQVTESFLNAGSKTVHRLLHQHLPSPNRLSMEVAQVLAHQTSKNGCQRWSLHKVTGKLKSSHGANFI